MPLKDTTYRTNQKERKKMNKIDITEELAILLNYVSRAAVITRSDTGDISLPLEERQTNIRWMAESLHNLRWLGDAIREDNPTRIIHACDFHIETFKEYNAGYTNCYKGNPGPIFERLRERRLDLEEAIMAFEKIKEKAIAKAAEDAEK